MPFRQQREPNKSQCRGGQHRARRTGALEWLVFNTLIQCLPRVSSIFSPLFMSARLSLQPYKVSPIIILLLWMRNSRLREVK